MRKSGLLTIAFAVLCLVSLPSYAADQNPVEVVPHARPGIFHDDFERSMRAMREDMNRLFSNFFNEDFEPLLDEEFSSVPTTDIIEQDGQYIVKIELPGINPDEVDLSVSGNSIVLKGEKIQQNEFKNEDYIRKESSYGAFSRVVNLPFDADLEKADAQYKDGILTVSVPKKEGAQAQSKKLTIRRK